MSVQTIAAADALARLAEFSAIIDARSESEFAHDHLPGAVNWPSLNDQQRARVGTLYKQASPFEARKLGAALVARNIADHIERELAHTSRRWRPLLYCWRGGQRSGALALVLGQIGFQVTLIEGGYKAFRVALLTDIPAQVQRLRLRVVCGPTGSGKTRLLHALATAGAQVLDLEGLASHRSSVLGMIPGQPQPTQKRFETLLWDTLRRFDSSRPVFVEAESKKVGNLAVPHSLMAAMRESPCLLLQLPDDERVALLMEDYAFFAQDIDFFCRRLEALTMLRSKAVVEAWKAEARNGRIESVVRDLLRVHYDPGYAESTRRHFSRFADAAVLVAPDRSIQTMSGLAQSLADPDD